MSLIDGPRLAPASGTAKSLVVLLHGYGADGNDLIGLGREWASALPDTAFASPHAPEPCVQNPMGRQWWDLAQRSPEERWKGACRAAPSLEAFLTSEMERTGLPASRVALVGFSQGTMMALHVGLRWTEPFAGILGYSGAIAGPEHLKGDLRSKPPVLLCHGTADQVIPIDALVETVDALARADVACGWHVAHGLGHGIDGGGLQIGADMLGRVLA